MTDLSLPDLAGEHYTLVLARLHQVLRPQSYLEIGVAEGASLALARCPAIGVDPGYALDPSHLPALGEIPQLHLFRLGSDDFFARFRPAELLGRPLDMAFLDGMHRCEFLLRDFLNTERCCRRNSLILLHDCLPVEVAIATRQPHQRPPVVPDRALWWTGDVWRTALLLRRYRPDLTLTVLDAEPTGLVVVTNLDPDSTVLADNYDRFVRMMLSWQLDEIGLGRLFAELRVEPAAGLERAEDLSARFWL